MIRPQSFKSATLAIPRVKDVICGRTMDQEKARGRTIFEGLEYYFCSISCKREFDFLLRKIIHTDSQD